jgi:hypothetical protein
MPEQTVQHEDFDEPYMLIDPVLNGVSPESHAGVTGVEGWFAFWDAFAYAVHQSETHTQLDHLELVLEAARRRLQEAPSAWMYEVMNEWYVLSPAECRVLDEAARALENGLRERGHVDLGNGRWANLRAELFFDPTVGVCRLDMPRLTPPALPQA